MLSLRASAGIEIYSLRFKDAIDRLPTRISIRRKWGIVGSYRNPFKSLTHIHHVRLQYAV